MHTLGTKLVKTDNRTRERRSQTHSTCVPEPSLPKTYSVDLKKRLVMVTFTKRLTFRKIESYALDLVADPQFDPDFSEIVDLRGVEEVELNAKQAMKLADQIDPFSTGSKRAFVAQSQQQINACDMHRILRADDNIRIFFSIDEARRWIGE